MQRYRLTIPKKYTDKTGQEKTSWKNVGSMVHFPAQNGKSETFIIEIDLLGVQIRAYPVETQQNQQQVQDYQPMVDFDNPTAPAQPQAPQNNDIEDIANSIEWE